ncbi:MAG: hypothetical protein EXS35_11410 [Pedosphaera sp.]|nr:hypothetical protein [Pedosphaera sp.]
MRPRPILWFVISLLCLVGAVYFWRLGDRWAATKKAARDAAVAPAKPATNSRRAVTPAASPQAALLSQPLLTTMALAATVSAPPPPTPKPDKFANRLRNTTKSVDELLGDDRAILLENALLDTRESTTLSVPAHLSRPVGSDPGAYIVQARGLIGDAFRAKLRDAGATVVAYIPNNAYLVRASAETAQQLGADAATEAVLPYEPYFKIKSSLLKSAIEREPMPADAGLNLLLFADRVAATKAELKKLGAEIFAEERSPFGPVVRVKPAADKWFEIALLTGVQAIEPYRSRVTANDLSRVRVGVSTDARVATNYLNLTGLGVLVNVNDSGVDATHPDFAPAPNPRIFGDVGGALLDTSGHGTHVAGIIAGSGLQSTTVSNALGSINPGTNGQYRGKAPAANIFSLSLGVGGRLLSDFTGGVPDTYLQESAAQTNAHISNSSWHYLNDQTYDIGASSYDAAVRDALPGVTGSQPVLFVFAAGNDGRGTDTGLSGDADSIDSPGTAKNVITVGAIELARNITNKVWFTNGGTNCCTNTPWAGMTSADNQVASFSSRGNVGIGIEGDSGRFKPDVVAPGTFVVSTRSSQWDEKAYYNPTNHTITSFSLQTAAGTNLNYYSRFVPNNAVALHITVFSGADMPIYVWPGTDPSATPFSFVRTNEVIAPPDNGANFGPRGTTWWWAVGNATATETNIYTVQVDLTTTNDNGNYFEVLSNLNNSINGAAVSGTPPHYYRYESGTSMSAADVSGTLALMQEFFTTGFGFHRTNSPALMKALLINGARSVGSLYDLQTDGQYNYQGWGLIKLRNSIPGGLTNLVVNPGGGYSMWFADQSPTNALATGQSQTRFVTLPSVAARNVPLRCTLVWTDPPGNPVAGVKLVNDLDLVVTNLATGDVYYGNDISGGANFNSAWDTNSPAKVDAVNNVENVYLAAVLGSNGYSVTVRARRVNVNSVTAHANDVVQDYALVISDGDGQVLNALTVSEQPVAAAPPGTSQVTPVANSINDGQASGFLIDNQRVGANTPLLGTTNGMTNQWHFYIVTNTTSFTNAAFGTFLPANLALPRMGVREVSQANATRAEADLDLYVSTNPGLTNLDPAVIASASRSVGRDGSEQVVLSNAVANQIYYLGVKSEDYQAGEFSLFGVFSLSGFDNSNGVVQCFNFPQAIPDRSPDNVVGNQNVARVFCPCVLEGVVRRVVATNLLAHEHLGDVLGVLSHGDAFAALNNHRAPPVAPTPPGPYGFIYEDNGENDIIAPAGYDLMPPDGPGKLRDFVGEKRSGAWFFTFLDNSLTQTGRVESVGLLVEKAEDDTNSAARVLAPDSWYYLPIEVPVGATNLTVCVSNSGPVELYIRKGSFPTQTAYDKFLAIAAPGNCLSLTLFDLPPLSQGTYYIGVFNSSGVQQTFRVFTSLGIGAVVPLPFTGGGGLPLLDDAITNSSIFVASNAPVGSVEVGLRIDHPRASDLAITLISPGGTRVLLMENRGRTNDAGIGSTFAFTNVVPVSANGGAAPQTNIVDTGSIQGSLTVTYQFFTVPDRMTIYYENNLIRDTGLVSGAGQFTVNYGPGSSTQVIFVMNESGNSVTNTQWNFTVSDVQFGHNYLTFTENTNRTTTPIKFLEPPYLPPSLTTNLLISGFEAPTTTGDYVSPQIVDGWSLSTTNPVTVFNDPTLVHAGVNSLALRAGQMQRALATTSGRGYRVKFAHRQAPNCVEFTNFPSAAGVTLTGDASPTGGVIRLTPALQDKGGNMWLAAKPKVAGGFDTRFHFRINDLGNLPGTPPGADGIVFSIQNVAAADPQFALSASSNYVSVFLNTFHNWPGCFDYSVCDVSHNSIGILTNSTYLAQTDLTPIPINLSDGAVHEAHFVYDGSKLNAWVDNVLVLANVSVPGMASAMDGSGHAWVGFSSHTGWAWENHDILDWTFCSLGDGSGAQVFVPGALTNSFLSTTTNWVTNSIFFNANANSTPLNLRAVSGESGELVDTFTLDETAAALYVLPEESLAKLTGENAQGTWQLEVWDSRAGAALNASLVSWAMNLTFQSVVPLPGTLTHGAPLTNSVPPGQIAYFIVDVPPWARFATNILITATAPVNVWFNQNIPPTTTNFGDVKLIGPAVTGLAELNTIGSVPALVPGARYYLGVQNPGLTTVTFAIEVDFDITPLTNAISLDAVLAAGTLPRYFSYDVSSNAFATAFEIIGPTTNVDLAVRYGVPLPTLTSYDYLGANPSSQNENVIVATNSPYTVNSSPVPLTPGRWYLGAFNRTAVPAGYAIRATELTAAPTIIDLTNGVPFDFNSGPGAALTNFFRFTITNSAPGVRFFLYNLSGNGDLTLQSNAWPLIPPYYTTSQSPGSNAEFMLLRTNFSLPDLNTAWYLGVPNNTTNVITYTILAVTETNQCFAAFPGAQGAGACAVGGRGGSVYHVTNLNDDGPGSLRFGLRGTNVTVVFDLAGTITLYSDLKINRPYITIAGQTAPGEGITLRGRVTSVQDTHDIIVRYLRFRPGDLDCPNFQDDSFHFDNARDVIADHISGSWSIDETLSATDSTNVTVQWSMIAESLNTSCHPSGAHGYGSSLRYGYGTLSFHHNLFADNSSHNPRLGDNLNLDFVNNVIYNWGDRAGYSEDDSADNPGGFTNRLNYIGNYLIAGSNTVARNTAFRGGTTNTWIFSAANLIDSNTNGVPDGVNTGPAMLANPYTPVGAPFFLPAVSIEFADSAYARVLAFAGASLTQRDSADRRIVGGVRSQTGAIIDSQNSVGGWPLLSDAPRPVDTDLDGMPDYWETTLALNPAVPSNNNDRDADGYTDLEEYLNWLGVPHALTLHDTPVDVDLFKLAGNTGALTFGVANGTNGSVTLLPDGRTARFTPDTAYSGFASFNFSAKDYPALSQFQTTVRVMVSGVDIVYLTNPPPITIITLTNGVPYFGSNSAPALTNIDYYRFVVSSNAALVQFEINGASANFTLVARKGLPLPDLVTYDYLSANAGTNDEVIVVFTNSVPVLLSPGDWFLGAVNLSGAPATYAIKATEFPGIITLTNAIGYFTTNSGVITTNDYYRYIVSSNAGLVAFEILGPTADVTLVARKGFPLPGLASFDYRSANPGTNDELIVVFTNSAPVALSPGDWHLTAVNISGGPASYTVKATEFPGIVTLTNGIAFSKTNAAAGETNYYRYTVTSNAIRTDFEILSPSGDITLVLRKGLPLPDLVTFDYMSANPGTANELIMVLTNTAPVVLSPGDWYLTAVNISGAPASYAIRATEYPPIITLTNAIPYANTNAGGASAWYKYTVTTNAVRVRFEINHPSANMTLVARKGPPVPSLTLFDYRSQRPGTNDEVIIIRTNSAPVPLSVGDWYLTAVNLSGGPAAYAIKATEFAALISPIITLTNGIPYDNVNTPAETNTDYYRYTVTTNAVRAQFEIYNASADLTLVARKGLPLPSLFRFDYLSANPNTNDELIVIFTNSVPRALSAGDWYLAAVNVSAVPASYTIKATEWSETGRPILITDEFVSTNGFCITWTSLPGVHYYVQGRINVTDTNWDTVSPTITAVSTNTTWCLALPSPYHYFRVVEGLVIVDPGIPGVITLTNSLAYFATNAPATTNINYFRYRVTPSAARAQFEINGPSADFTLLARKGLPLPNLATNDYSSVNLGLNDELITVFTNSAPVALSAGDWFLAAINLSGAPASYAIKATEWPVTGQPIVVTGTEVNSNGFCLTWDSLIGVHYYVQGLTNLFSPPWVTISPTITATNESTTYCVPLPSPFQYFRVRDGLVLLPVPPPWVPAPPTGVNVSRATNGFLITWDGGLGARYQVQWAGSLPPAWASFTNVITSGTTAFSFLDDGSQTSGFGAARYYQVYQVP